ncbi:MAG: RidA family protein [Methylobacteriaceae bacterium]|nr:RidA family protein [Methylobacteriaceae bacterium]
MSDVVKVKSGSKFEEINSYSRLVQAGDYVFVSNTAGRNYKTRAIAADVVGQAEQAFRNIEAALAAVGLTLKDVVAIRCHVPDPAETGLVGRFLGDRFRGIDPAATMICTPLAHHEMKVEFEVTAYRRRDPSAPEKRISIEIG